jgi:hypothetical protein
MTQGLPEPRVSRGRNSIEHGSGNGTDTDARDDANSAGHMALLLSSTAFGDYSHSDREEDEDENYDDDDDGDDDNDDEAEDSYESFFISSSSNG